MVGGCGPDGDLATFSFHPVKHITTGEGGAVTTRDPKLARRMRAFRNHGMECDPAFFRNASVGPWYYEQQALGHNLRLTELQAALGLSQLGKLDRFLARRRALAGRYDALLEDVPMVTPVTRGSACEASAYHLYTVLIDFVAIDVRRADLMERLRKRGIGTQVHYIPLPMQPIHAERGSNASDFPGALRHYERTLTLPLFPAMDDGDPERVVHELEEGLRALGAR